MLGAWVRVFLCVRMRVGMCDCDCVRLFFVSGWVLDCPLSWISLGSPSNVGPISSLPNYLQVVGVSAHQCTCGSRCVGLGALVCAGSLPVASCQGLDPWGLLGLCLGSDMSQGLGSLRPWLDLLGRSWLPAEPVGSSLQLPGASALWLLGGSPGTLPCSSLEGCGCPGGGSPGVPVLWGFFGCLWLGSPPYLSWV
ncbi:hypothetical protein ATANTOWER_028705 [Ataeniobius toweri]|uniref:Secreted protein n=1 Tax=Ataeniobius toweri TaxID=208326 RepID=A0ABU7ASB4_9TELE|nr:hypothetical protein [Ataeniobius toweri]